MNNTLNNTKGIDKSKVLLILLIVNIIPYLYPLIYLIGMSEGNEYIVILGYLYILPNFIPWTLIILLSISIVHIIIDNDIERVSIKPNTYLILLSLGIQILALMWFVFTPTTTFFSYHFIMLISLIPGGLAYYVGYRSRTIIDNTEARKNYIPYILPLIILAIVSIIAVAWYFYSGWINSPADIPQEYNENNVTPPEYQDSTPPLDTNF